MFLYTFYSVFIEFLYIIVYVEGRKSRSMSDSNPNKLDFELNEIVDLRRTEACSTILGIVH